MESVVNLDNMDMFYIDRLIDWCLMPTLGVFQLYRGMKIVYILT
jgi:hypothetical protein